MWGTTGLGFGLYPGGEQGGAGGTLVGEQGSEQESSQPPEVSPL